MKELIKEILRDLGIYIKDMFIFGLFWYIVIPLKIYREYQADKIKRANEPERIKQPKKIYQQCSCGNICYCWYCWY